ncbi:hypothetical protein [Streptomyces sp. NPDC090021]|uniref:hypothetical protein n=1 Tax=Streptomyces sp. NPDC090021 TaxID=3365919 RepID=UPI00381717F2
MTTSNALVKVIGGTRLAGRYRVQGSKNIALHLYAATVLADAPVTLHNAPDIVDSGVCARILQHTGMGADFDGTTFTTMLLAARAEGTSLITSPSIEPEVTETARFLSARGVGIVFDGQSLLVTGTDYIGGGEFTVAGDRIEAATVAMATAATRGTVTLDGIALADLPDGLTGPLTAAGLTLTPPADRATGHLPAVEAVAGPLTAVETRTGPHPGLPTDTAPQLAAMLTQATGTSLIRERIYPQRDTHAEPLRAFGARVRSTGNLIRVRGGKPLRAADVEAADIRAVTALVLAALAADGTSTIRGLHHLRRGYGHLLDGLATLGADITVEPEV